MLPLPPQDGIRCVKNVEIPMADGVRLALDMHLPDDPDWQQTPRPLILEYIPYRKDDTPPYSGQHQYFARHGYIGARLDCRGTGASAGINTDEYTLREQLDAVEAIAWLARQPWCSGAIAMTGGSYGGFTCVQVAAHAPPALKTIMPIYFTDDRYTDDCHYRGGALRCYYDIGAYGISMVGMNAMPPYPEYSGAAWADIWEQHLTHNTPYILEWLSHQTDGDYWRPGSLKGRYDQVEIPVFMIGGWRDGYPNPPLSTYDQLQTPKKLLIGPWNHARPNIAIPGPRIDHLAEIVRWCDHYLKGEDNGIPDEPPVQVYVQTYDEPQPYRKDTSGYWRSEENLLPKGSQPTTLHLAPGGCLLEEALTVEDIATDTGAFDEYQYRPTVGLCGGLWSGGVPFGLPADQRPDEIHGPTYTTPSLDEPVEILGRPSVQLYVQSTAPVMAFVARLADVAPDGTSALVCTGVLNATRRNSLTDPEALDPEQIYQLSFELDATAWRFQTGHRLRLSVCSADFPNLWPTPYLGTNRIYRSADHASQLILPTVPIRPAGPLELPADEARFAPGDDTQVYRLAPDQPPWQIVHDLLGDRLGLKTHTCDLSHPNDSTDLTSQRLLEVWANNRDPADVVATGSHRRRIVRSDGHYQIDASCTLRSTATAFHLTIDLTIDINDRPHHQQRWVRTFARHLL